MSKIHISECFEISRLHLVEAPPGSVAAALTQEDAGRRHFSIARLFPPTFTGDPVSRGGARNKYCCCKSTQRSHLLSSRPPIIQVRQPGRAGTHQNPQLPHFMTTQRPTRPHLGARARPPRHIQGEKRTHRRHPSLALAAMSRCCT